MSRSLTIARTYLGKRVEIQIDRPLGSAHPRYGFLYPINYGFVPGTMAPDGAELDAYFLGSDEPLETAAGACVGIIHRLQDDDDKLVIVAKGVTLSKEEILKAVHFQEQWFEHKLIPSATLRVVAGGEQ